MMSDLYQACSKFREAIIRTPKEKLSISFQEFPHGSCGDTCLILGYFLEYKGFGVFNYVCGNRDEHSHAWLQMNETIVDITGSQFEDCQIDVYVGEKNTFYESFNVESIHIYYESLVGGSLKTDNLWEDYRVICQFL